MGLRQWFNENPRVTAGVVAAVAAVAVGYAVMQVFGGRPGIRSELPEAFYTIDDGQSFFAANSANVPPFDHKGKQAVRAYVFECGGQRFVAYVERFSPEAHQAMVENKATPDHMINGRELKKPGEGTWVKSSDVVASAKVADDVRCPHGGKHTPEPVEP